MHSTRDIAVVDPPAAFTTAEARRVADWRLDLHPVADARFRAVVTCGPDAIASFVAETGVLLDPDAFRLKVLSRSHVWLDPPGGAWPAFVADAAMEAGK